MPKLGNVFMIVAPSGAGKSSLVNALLQHDTSLMLSISSTTRAPRSSEQNGREYYFVTCEAFQQLRDKDQLLEWATVHGNFYGTAREPLIEATKSGRDVVLEIDWQGARQVRRFFSNATGIFILPPSIDSLEMRLKARGQDGPAVITHRLMAASNEISHASECEYVIINQEFSTALDELKHIVLAARLRYSLQAAQHASLFAKLGISSAY